MMEPKPRTTDTIRLRMNLLEQSMTQVYPQTVASWMETNPGNTFSKLFKMERELIIITKTEDSCFCHASRSRREEENTNPAVTIYKISNVRSTKTMRPASRRSRTNHLKLWKSFIDKKTQINQNKTNNNKNYNQMLIKQNQT